MIDKIITGEIHDIVRNDKLVYYFDNFIGYLLADNNMFSRLFMLNNFITFMSNININ